MTDKDIHKANKDYDDWLRKELKNDVFEDDLKEKYKKMGEDAFTFLRATYWRWAERILIVCPDLEDAPVALSVGDIHLENFGTWRDEDGRLVWGVNDFDEAADMPYVLDLVRLATSATLAPDAPSTDDICAAVLDGYKKGLAKPRPSVLDEKHRRLRKLVVVSESGRSRFWEKIDKLEDPKEPAPKRYLDVLKKAMPDFPRPDVIIRPRKGIGTGSLGRPRWAGISEWRGGRVVREAKAVVTSAWVRARGKGSTELRCEEIAYGTYRTHDPWYNLAGNIAVRRISPNNRKLEVEDMGHVLLRARMLRAMGRELASVHLGTGNRRAAIVRDFHDRGRGWLRKASDAANEFVRADFKAWTEHA